MIFAKLHFPAQRCLCHFLGELSFHEMSKSNAINAKIMMLCYVVYCTYCIEIDQVNPSFKITNHDMNVENVALLLFLKGTECSFLETNAVFLLCLETNQVQFLY